MEARRSFPAARSELVLQTKKFLPTVGAWITCTEQLDMCVINLGQIRLTWCICVGGGSKPTTYGAVPRFVHVKHYGAQGQDCNQTVQKRCAVKQSLIPRSWTGFQWFGKLCLHPLAFVKGRGSQVARGCCTHRVPAVKGRAADRRRKKNHMWLISSSLVCLL